MSTPVPRAELNDGFRATRKPPPLVIAKSPKNEGLFEGYRGITQDPSGVFDCGLYESQVIANARK